MAQKQRLTINVDELRPGMVLAAASARNNTLRRVYKVVTNWSDYHKVWCSEVWSIQVRWNKKRREWEEECSMVSNGIGRLSHVVEIVNGEPTKRPLTIVERDPAVKEPKHDVSRPIGTNQSESCGSYPCGTCENP